jgi:hypothetical protein
LSIEGKSPSCACWASAHGRGSRGRRRRHAWHMAVRVGPRRGSHRPSIPRGTGATRTACVVSASKQPIKIR